MLTCQSLTITHRKDGRILLRDFSFTLREGEKAALIGEEGDGKSTLLKLLHDPALAEEYVSWTGTISKGGLLTAYLSQELTPEKAALPAWEFFSSVPVDNPRELSRLAEALSIPADSVYSEQRMGTFSGGERVKLRLLRALLTHPDILLLDEPSSDLDLPALVWLEEFLSATELSVLFVSHDEVLLEHCAETVIHLEQILRKTEPKHTVSRTGYLEYVRRRGDLIERSAAQAKNDKARFDEKMERYRRVYERVHHEQNAVSRQNPHGGQMLKKKMHTVKAMETRFEREKENLTKKIDAEEAVMIDFPPVNLPAGKTVLDLDLPELRIGDRVLLRDLRLTVSGGEHVVIVGPNGCGKTTLLRHIASLLLPRKDIRTAYMPQDYDEGMPRALTPVEYLQSELNDYTNACAVKVRTYLGSVKFTPAEMAHPLGELSGGQRAKLCFLSMILRGADVLLLDEPTRNLSPMTNPVIRRILAGFGGTIIAVSHDRKFIEEVGEAVVQL